MDITKVHYDPAAAITVKAKKKIPRRHIRCSRRRHCWPNPDR